METSDSDYFESADEDFESEDETVISRKVSPKSDTEKQISLSHISSKIEELNVDCTVRKKDCNTITIKQPEELDNLQKENDATKALESLLVLSENQLEQRQKPIEQSGTKNIQVSECTESSKISKDNLQHKKVEILESKEDFVAPTISDDYSEDSIKNIAKVVNKTNQIASNSPGQDENLWEDDEVNWEEHEKPKQIQNRDKIKEIESQKSDLVNASVKDDENLWGDDEIDWETEGKLEENQEGKITIPLSKPTEEDLWQNDDWEPLEKPSEIPQCKPKPEEDSGWGRWNSWGMSSLLNTASQGVSTLTSHVSQGLSTVIEGGMGIPDPEQMAKEVSETDRQKLQFQDGNTSNDQKSVVQDGNTGNAPQLFGLGNLVGSVSHITKFVESTGTKVISGGLDTLESIGKKTMEVLQEGDPGLKKKRAFLKLDNGKPVLSQVLREAKEKAEKEIETMQEEYIVKPRKLKSYETLFDDYHGLVHLEALEMLSKLANIKLQNLNDSLSGEAWKDMQETMDQVKELCDLPDEEEDQVLTLEEIKEKITSAVEDLNVTISYEKLLNTSQETDGWIENISSNLISEEELHQQAIETLAQTTALAVEQFHKIGELLLVKEHRSTADEADSLVQLTTIIKSLIVKQANQFTDKLSSLQISDKNNSNEMITNIFFEAANSSSYIQDAFQLLIPVLQVGAV